MIKVLSATFFSVLFLYASFAFAQIESSGQIKTNTPQNLQVQNPQQNQTEVKFDIAGYTVIKKSIAYIKEKDQLIAPTIQIIGKNGIVFEINNNPEKIAFTKIFFGIDAAEIQSAPLDLEGNGSKYLIMSTFSGGVDCCYNYYLISLMPENLEIRQVINALGSKLRFEKPANNRAYLIKVNDTTMVDFYVDEKEAYQPEITLAFNNTSRTFEPDLRFLKQDINNPTFDGIKKVTTEAVEKIQKEYGSLDIILKPIVINAAKLAYSGNYKLSRRLIDEVWPKNFTRISKDKFQNSFGCRLKRSPYSRELSASNPDLAKVSGCLERNDELEPDQLSNVEEAKK